MANPRWDAALLCLSVPPTAPGVSCRMRCTPGRTPTGRFLIKAPVLGGAAEVVTPGLVLLSDHWEMLFSKKPFWNCGSF